MLIGVVQLSDLGICYIIYMLIIDFFLLTCFIILFFIVKSREGKKKSRVIGATFLLSAKNGKMDNNNKKS